MLETWMLETWLLETWLVSSTLVYILFVGELWAIAQTKNKFERVTELKTKKKKKTTEVSFHPCRACVKFW